MTINVSINEKMAKKQSDMELTSGPEFSTKCCYVTRGCKMFHLVPQMHLPLLLGMDTGLQYIESMCTCVFLQFNN